MPKKFEIQFFNYNETTRLKADCNAITFVNPSTTVAFTLNNFPVPAGASISFEGNENEINITEFNINFGAVTTGECWVIKKINLN